MLKKKKICFISSTRADYSLLLPLILKIKKDKLFTLQLIVTGSHLDKKYGNTINEIEKEKIKIDYKVKILDKNHIIDRLSTIKSTSEALQNISICISKLNPDLLILLGDRYEILAASIGASFLRIPIAHIHGGELTEGAIDDSIRHSITKMSSLHLVSHEVYRKRVIQLGESPKNVFNIGAMSMDTIENTKFLDRKTLEKKLNVSLKEKIFLITFHPVTLEKDTAQKQIKYLLKAISKFKETTFIFTSPNADMFSHDINIKIKSFVKQNKNAYYIKSLGKEKYFSFLKIASAVIGNSSSGIIEAPYFKVPVVNIGDRQKGRLRSPNIIDCKATEKDIYKSIKILFSKKYKNKLVKTKNIYGEGKASNKALKIIKKYIDKLEVKKSFHDIKFKHE